MARIPENDQIIPIAKTRDLVLVKSPLGMRNFEIRLSHPGGKVMGEEALLEYAKDTLSRLQGKMDNMDEEDRLLLFREDKQKAKAKKRSRKKPRRGEEVTPRKVRRKSSYDTYLSR